MDYDDGLDLRGSGARTLSDLIFVVADDGIVVNYGAGSFRLVGISQAQLDASDFIFLLEQGGPCDPPLVRCQATRRACGLRRR